MIHQRNHEGLSLKSENWLTEGRMDLNDFKWIKLSELSSYLDSKRKSN